MFGTIRKHQTWLWVVIIVVIIISFVVYFSPYSKINESRGPLQLGSINGEPVSEDVYTRAQREMYLQYFLRSGRWPDEDARQRGFDLERETYQWLLLTQKVRSMGIDPSPEAIETQARQLLRPFEQMGVKSPVTFFNEVLRPRGLMPEDFERFVRNYLGLQEMISVIGASGKLVAPTEIQALYERENQAVATSAVFFSASNYLAGVSVTPEALTQFYSNRLAVYRIPERLQINYVTFPFSNFLAKAETSITNLNELVDMNFTQLGTNTLQGAKTPEETKAVIRQELLRREALLEARKAASDFARPLFDKEKIELGDLEKLAKEKGLECRVTAPFTREDGPAELEGGQELVKAAFLLTPEDPVARPQITEDGVGIISFNSKVPSEIPPLDQIRSRVEQDYRFSQALNQARQAGIAFQRTLTNSLAQGKTFSQVVEEAKVTAVDLPPFALSTRTLPEAEQHLNLNQVKEMAFSIKPGQASSFQFSAEGGAVLFVKSNLPIDTARMQAEMPNFASFVRRTRQEEAFNHWFRREAEKGLRDTPLARPEPPPSMQSAPATKAKS